jgi:hypothetical protein
MMKYSPVTDHTSGEQPQCSRKERKGFIRLLGVFAFFA